METLKVGLDNFLHYEMIIGYRSRSIILHFGHELYPWAYVNICSPASSNVLKSRVTFGTWYLTSKQTTTRCTLKVIVLSDSNLILRFLIGHNVRNHSHISITINKDALATMPSQIWWTIPLKALPEFSFPPLGHFFQVIWMQQWVNTYKLNLWTPPMPSPAGFMPSMP